MDGYQSSPTCTASMASTVLHYVLTQSREKIQSFIHVSIEKQIESNGLPRNYIKWWNIVKLVDSFSGAVLADPTLFVLILLCLARV
jgi:hypothetical protein